MCAECACTRTEMHLYWGQWNALQQSKVVPSSESMHAYSHIRPRNQCSIAYTHTTEEYVSHKLSRFPMCSSHRQLCVVYRMHCMSSTRFCWNFCEHSYINSHQTVKCQRKKREKFHSLCLHSKWNKKFAISKTGGKAWQKKKEKRSASPNRHILILCILYCFTPT